MKKKILFIIFLVVILVSLALGGIGLCNYLRVKYAKIEVTLIENLTIEFNDTKKVSDYITSINGKIINDYTITSTHLGEKEIKFKFINDDGIKVSYSFKINVVDTTPPLIRLGSSYSVRINSEDELVDKIICADYVDESPNCYIEGNYDLTKEGKYELKFIGEDASGNKIAKLFTLNVYTPSNNTTPSNPTYTYFEDVVTAHKKENTKIGLDLSTWQGEVDFEKLKSKGVEFVILRVGSSEGREGEYFLDSKFIRNITEANKYDIPVGIYYYSYANSTKKAKENAEWILEQIKDYKVDLPIAFDWENWSYYNSYNLSIYELNQMADIFIETVEEKGYKGMLYGSMSYLEDMWDPNDKRIWVAQYLSDYRDTSTYEGEYLMWQMCSDGIVDGIDGYVDINIMYN